MNYFLLHYDPRTGEPATVEAFEEDWKAAFEALRRANLTLEGPQEAVVFAADAVETLRKTHSRYFHTLPELLNQFLDPVTAALQELPAFQGQGVTADDRLAPS